MGKQVEASGTAALVCHGMYQYVRLPQEFRFEGDQVRISKYRNGVILTPLPAGGSNRVKKTAKRSASHPAGT